METLLPNLYNVEKGPCTPFNLLKGFLQYFFFCSPPLSIAKGVYVGFYFVLRRPSIAERGSCRILFCSPLPFDCWKGSVWNFILFSIALLLSKGQCRNFCSPPLRLLKKSVREFILFSTALRLPKWVCEGIFFVIHPLWLRKGSLCGILFCSLPPFDCERGLCGILFYFFILFFFLHLLQLWEEFESFINLFSTHFVCQRDLCRILFCSPPPSIAEGVCAGFDFLILLFFLHHFNCGRSLCEKFYSPPVVHGFSWQL